MKGIRKRILIGCMSIVVLLFFSGMVSLYELTHMSKDIQSILDGSRKGIATSEGILTSLRENDKAVVSYAIAKELTAIPSINESLTLIRERIADARSKSNQLVYVSFDSLSMTIDRMEENVQRLLRSRVVDAEILGDTLQLKVVSFNGAQWYRKNYAPLYDEATLRVLDVMTNEHNALTPQAERLSNNAYRAVTPVFISLLIMILILLVFYFFIMFYIGRPIININKALDDTIRYKVPFIVKGECRDEVLGIKEKLESLFKNPRIMK